MLKSKQANSYSGAIYRANAAGYFEVIPKYSHHKAHTWENCNVRLLETTSFTC